MRKKSLLEFNIRQFLKLPFLLAVLLFVGIFNSQARYFEPGMAPSTMSISGLEIPGFNGTFILVDYGEDQIDSDIYALEGDENTRLFIQSDGSWALVLEESPSEMGVPFFWEASGNINDPNVNYYTRTMDGWDEDGDGNWFWNDGVTTWSAEAPNWAVSWAGGGFGPAYLASGGTSLESGSTAAFAEKAAQLNVGLEFSDGQWIVK
jgi:hypothetical protein